MPVHNEAATIPLIVDRVLNAPTRIDGGEPLTIELVCVDDASGDGSAQVLRDLASTDPRIRVLAHEQNQGKGAAIRTAINAMTGDIALIQDADLEYDPTDFPRLLEPILAGEADAVYGSRFLSSRRRQVHRFWHQAANKALTLLCNVLSDLSLTDMETCYKAVRADVLKDLTLRSERFEIEPEITIRLARRGARLYEVPISYHGRTREEGKKIGAKDGIEAVLAMLRFRFDGIE